MSLRNIHVAHVKQFCLWFSYNSLSLVCEYFSHLLNSSSYTCVLTEIWPLSLSVSWLYFPVLKWLMTAVIYVHKCVHMSIKMFFFQFADVWPDDSN